MHTHLHTNTQKHGLRGILHTQIQHSQSLTVTCTHKLLVYHLVGVYMNLQCVICVCMHTHTQTPDKHTPPHTHTPQPDNIIKSECSGCRLKMPTSRCPDGERRHAFPLGIGQGPGAAACVCVCVPQTHTFTQNRRRHNHANRHPDTA